MLLGMNENILKEKNGYNACYEIERQVELWQEIINNLELEKERIKTFLSRIPIEECEIILCGAGSSGLAAESIEKYLKYNLGYNVNCVNSTEVLLQPDKYMDSKNKTLLVSFSSSGSTPETVEVTRIFKKKIKELYQIPVICVTDGIIVNENKDDGNTLYIPLPENTKGKSFAATAEYTCLVLQALCIFDIDNLNYYRKFTEYASKRSEKLFTEEIGIIENIIEFDSISLTSMGSLEFEVLAKESALKAVEFTAGKWMSNYSSSLEFRHGPKLIMNSPVISLHYLYPDTDIVRYDLDMMEEIATDRNNGITVVVGAEKKDSLPYVPEYYFEFDKTKVEKVPTLAILLYALVMHVLIVRVSIRKGVKADWPSSDDLVPKVANRVNIY